MLKLAGETMSRELIEALKYQPGLPYSGDLEPATKSITAVSKQVLPDYSTGLTIAAPSSGRIQVLRLCLRLAVTIDSFEGGATRLNYSVQVNGSERLTGYWTSNGGQAAAVDLTSGQFNLGTANTVEVFLWVDQGNTVVSLCQVWLGVGSQSTSSAQDCISLVHSGFVQVYGGVNRQGTGTPTLDFYSLDSGEAFNNSWFLQRVSGIAPITSYGDRPTQFLVNGVLALAVFGSVVTDLNYITAVKFIVRSER